MCELKEETIKEVLAKAIEQLPAAYVPYSHFHVGAALKCADGAVYTGCNIENASYPAGICAERTAIFKAVSEGHREFECIAIVGGKDGKMEDYCPPCGVCRQVMREFVNPDRFHIILAKSLTDYRIYTLNDLLPESFGPENL